MPASQPVLRVSPRRVAVLASRAPDSNRPLQRIGHNLSGGNAGASVSAPPADHTHACDRPAAAVMRARPAGVGRTVAGSARPRSDRLSSRCACQTARRGEKPAPVEHQTPTDRGAERRPPRPSGAAVGKREPCSRGGVRQACQTTEPNRSDGRRGGYKIALPRRCGTGRGREASRARGGRQSGLT